MKKTLCIRSEKLKIIPVYAKNLMTLSTFLIRNEVSRSTYYALQRVRLGPKEIRIGRAVYISYRDEWRWTKRMSGSSISRPKLLEL
jgi:hypothetical protein